MFILIPLCQSHGSIHNITKITMYNRLYQFLFKLYLMDQLIMPGMHIITKLVTIGTFTTQAVGIATTVMVWVNTTAVVGTRVGCLLMSFPQVLICMVSSGGGGLI